jgi:hypothetical protein
MKIHPETLFDYNTGCYCGVLVTERIMKKLAKLQAAHLESVKRLLMGNKEEVFPSMWTLSKANGKQETIRFIDTNRNLDDAIKAALRSDNPRPSYPTFIAASMKEAELMGDEYYSGGEL